MRRGKPEKQEYKVHGAVMNKLEGRKGARSEDGSYTNRRYVYGNSRKGGGHFCVQ